MSDADRPLSARQPSRRETAPRRGRMPTIPEDELREAVAARLRGDASESSTSVSQTTRPHEEEPTPAPDGGAVATSTTSHSEPSPAGPASTAPESAGSDPTGGNTPGGTGGPPDDGTRPFIKITPAREQVTPGHVVKALYGLYRAGSGRQLPFGIEQRLSFVSTHRTYEFLIHKPRATQRFDFYLGVTPYDPEGFEHLAANVRAMYPETFQFEIVPLSVAEIFEPSESPSEVTGRLSAFEGIDDLGTLEGFAPVDLDTTTPIEPVDEAEEPDEAEDRQFPELARWSGVQTKTNDWMTLLSRFSEVAVDGDDAYRSPLSVLLEQALATDEPFVYQVVFTPKRDWTKEAQHHKRNLKMGTTGLWSAFTQEFTSVLLGTSEEERRQRHRPDTPEQIGGTISGPDASGQSTQHSRMGQIDLKQPAITFDISLRAAGDAAVINGLTGAFTALSGPYYGIEGIALGENAREYRCLTDATLGRTGLKDRFSDVNPIIVASPDELANFVTVPNTGALPKPSRGASGGTPDARSPLTATDEELFREYDRGMCIGEAVTAAPTRDNIPIHLTADQLTHHVLRAATTGSGKTTAMINDALTAYDSLDGPIFIFDPKGGGLCQEYKRAHFRRFGDLDDVVHFRVPGPNNELPAFPFFDIRPQLAAGIARETAVKQKVDRYDEIGVYAIGEIPYEQAFVGGGILSHLIEALFDPVYGQDAFSAEELFTTARQMAQHQVLPAVSNPSLLDALDSHFDREEREWKKSVNAAINRIRLLRDSEFVWRTMNFVPEWDDEAGAYADEQMLVDLDEMLQSSTVVLVDTGELEEAGSNMFTTLFLDYLWSTVRIHQRTGRLPGTGENEYCINLIIDEAAPILQSKFLYRKMIPKGREFGLAIEGLVQFPEQIKQDALDTIPYKELLRNINTKLLGKLAIDEELAMTLFHEELDTEALTDRITSLPRGEWIAQLPDTGFMTATPELVTLKPLPIPPGHSAGDDPVDAGTYSPSAEMTYQEVDALQWSRTRFSYCLIPGVNSPLSAKQRQDQSRSDAVDDEEAQEENSASSGTSTDSGSAPDDAVSESADDSGSGAADQDDGPSDRRVGGASNEFGTVLGTGVSPADSNRDSPASSRDPDGIEGKNVGARPASENTSGASPPDASIDDDRLTDTERRFLQDVIAGINGELEGYDLTQSMTTIRDALDEELDENRLEVHGFIEIQSVYNRKYYYVTPKGQTAVDRTIYAGRNDGDPFEKTAHKVYVEYVARHLRNRGLLVETYYEPMAGGMVFDVAAFVPRDDGRRTLAVIAEVVTNIRSDLVLKHYDDLATFDRVRKMIIVPHTDVAHEIIRVLVDAGRLQTAPHRDIENYVRLSEKSFPDPREWRFVGGRNIIRAVDRNNEESER